VQQAGGKVTDFTAGDAYIFGRSIVAGSTALFPDLMKIITQSFDGIAID
jgi:hypothetical protein